MEGISLGCGGITKISNTDTKKNLRVMIKLSIPHKFMLVLCVSASQNLYYMPPCKTAKNLDSTPLSVSSHFKEDISTIITAINVY